MKYKSVILASVFCAASAIGASAASVNETSNVVFIVDESGSMGGEHAFLQDTISDLDSALAAAGVVNRSYGVIGYGNRSVVPRVVGAMADAATTATNLLNLVTNGGTEDGYAGIDAALSSLNYTAGAAINYVLVTDEDRDNTNNSLTFASIKNALTSRKIMLNAIVNANLKSDNNSNVLGISSDGSAYVADGSGGFTNDTGGVANYGSGTTLTNYVDLALQTGGAAWDLNRLRAGGLFADSFASAFVDIKVSEIISQPTDPSAVPLPAGFPLLIGGLAAMGAVGRRRKKAA